MSLGSYHRSALVLVGLVLLGTSACSKKTVQLPDPEPMPQAERVQPERPAPAPKAEAPAPIELKDIFFEFDQSRIRSDAMATLNANGKALLGDPTVRVTLEGHCDERGTVEYNLALGDRRARAAKDYLISYGVDPSRLTSVSYGEERPFVPGHTEADWAQNRRVHFVRKGAPGEQAGRLR